MADSNRTKTISFVDRLDLSWNPPYHQTPNAEFIADEMILNCSQGGALVVLPPRDVGPPFTSIKFTNNGEIAYTIHDYGLTMDRGSVTPGATIIIEIIN